MRALRGVGPTWCRSPGPQSSQVSKHLNHRNLTPRCARERAWCGSSRGVGLPARSPRKFPSTLTIATRRLAALVFAAREDRTT